jgi:hypothetical protein
MNKTKASLPTMNADASSPSSRNLYEILPFGVFGSSGSLAITWKTGELTEEFCNAI